MSSHRKCPLVGVSLPCTFRPSGRKRLLVGKVLWWELCSGGAKSELRDQSPKTSKDLKPKSAAILAFQSISKKQIPAQGEVCKEHSLKSPKKKPCERQAVSTMHKGILLLWPLLDLHWFPFGPGLDAFHWTCVGFIALTFWTSVLHCSHF